MAKKKEAADGTDQNPDQNDQVDQNPDQNEPLDLDAIDVVEMAERKPWPGGVAALEGSSGDMHSVHMRLTEILPFLPGAIDQAEGEVKDFLTALSHYL